MAGVSGLEGVTVADTEISYIDGTQGHLIYRGKWAKELALRHRFEEVAFLLWEGRLPTEEEARQLRNELAGQRELEPHLIQWMKEIPAEVGMMDVLRTIVSALGSRDYEWPPTRKQAVAIIARIPTIIAARWRILQGLPPIAPRTDLSHAENYLYLLTGEEPNSHHVRALEAYLILTMEHGMNASTFAARVAASTQTDFVSAVTAGIGTLKGPLHGGAPSEVSAMLESIGSKEKAESWIRQALERGERIMGFGHRVYKTYDPRAQALSQIAQEIAPNDDWFDFVAEVERTALRLLAEYKPGRKLYTNVEYYAYAVMKGVGLPEELFTPTFAVSRIVGWSAHILEQARNNRIFRPDARYIGPMPQEL